MNKIEEKRLTLFETAQKFGINATETIRCSQELDSLLNGCGAGSSNKRKTAG
nr:aspartyl-phosphate phosphatase Spo0E family protein [Bacillus velezensis]MDH3087320.1 aspartyl-phosphate phosphatase Spo0E family protein [Bacillus velezensis]MDH3104685.1 aspartyl-phosphate phosphatase Spo0E family protein [Bacillus velezensis]WEY80493.1 aspartyl-phosphate phosphatase Spo0E family protein [Bacillus velezensis]